MMGATEMDLHASSVGALRIRTGLPQRSKSYRVGGDDKQSHDDGRLSKDEIQWLEA